MIDISPYLSLALQGPKIVAGKAKELGLGPIDTIRLLRQMYDMDFMTAKEIATFTHTGMTLPEYQATLLPTLEEVIAELVREGSFSNNDNT